MWDTIILPTLRWVGSWLPSYLPSFFRQVERRFHTGNWTANYSIWKWVPLHYHPVVQGHLGPRSCHRIKSGECCKYEGIYHVVPERVLNNMNRFHAGVGLCMGSSSFLYVGLVDRLHRVLGFGQSSFVGSSLVKSLVEDLEIVILVKV
jgi:hypothetical protein